MNGLPLALRFACPYPQRFVCGLRCTDTAFTSNGKARLAWQRKSNRWWASVGGTEFNLIPDAPINGR